MARDVSCSSSKNRRRQNRSKQKPHNSTYYFDIPAQPVGTAWPTDGTAPAPGALPTAPGIRRNAFFGPRYFSTDVTGVKGFGLPKMRVLGESARFELRANAYNLFNQLNLYAPVNTITDPHFGRGGSVLSGRTVELEAHFKFGFDAEPGTSRKVRTLRPGLALFQASDGNTSISLAMSEQSCPPSHDS